MYPLFLNPVKKKKVSGLLKNLDTLKFFIRFMLGLIS